MILGSEEERGDGHPPCGRCEEEDPLEEGACGIPEVAHEEGAWESSHLAYGEEDAADCPPKATVTQERTVNHNARHQKT